MKLGKILFTKKVYLLTIWRVTCPTYPTPSSGNFLHQHHEVKDLKGLRDFGVRLCTFSLSYHRKSATWINDDFLLHLLEEHVQWLVTPEEGTYSRIFAHIIKHILIEILWTDVNWKNRGWERS